jgi:4-hydroxybenzoate polyprenyltransferase
MEFLNKYWFYILMAFLIPVVYLEIKKFHELEDSKKANKKKLWLAKKLLTIVHVLWVVIVVIGICFFLMDNYAYCNMALNIWFSIILILSIFILYYVYNLKK